MYVCVSVCAQLSLSNKYKNKNIRLGQEMRLSRVPMPFSPPRLCAGALGTGTAHIDRHMRITDRQRTAEVKPTHKNTHTGFLFWKVQSSTKHSPHTPTIQISVGGIYFCDITNTRKQLCSRNKPFVVVLEKGFFENEISPFGVDFEICNFV